MNIISRIWRRPAAAAVAAAAISLSAPMTSTAIPNGSLLPVADSTSTLPVPAYYVALPGADNFGNVPGAPTAVLGDTFSGKRLLTLRPPAGWKFVSVTAAADDRTFVLGVEWHPQPPAVPQATAWYLVRVTPGPKFHATMRKLRVPAPQSDSAVDAVALSPNGEYIATLGNVGGAIGRTGKEKLALRVYTVATGARVSTWSGIFYEGFDAYDTLSWTANGYLAFARNWFAPVAPHDFFGVRMLKVTHPAGDLVADSRLVWSTPVPLETPRLHKLSCAYGGIALVTPDGKTVVCTAYGVYRTPPPVGKTGCPAVQPWNDVAFLEYSTATGKLVRTLFRHDTNCFLAGSDIMWTSATGDAVIGFYAAGSPIGRQGTIRFGVFSVQGFAPLPVPPTTTTVPTAGIAW